MNVDFFGFKAPLLRLQGCFLSIFESMTHFEGRVVVYRMKRNETNKDSDPKHPKRKNIKGVLSLLNSCGSTQNKHVRWHVLNARLAK